MYICSECRRIFEEATEVKDFRGYYGETAAYELMYECPCCGSNDYYPTEECAGCGEYFDQDEIALYDGFCEACVRELEGRLEDLVAETFTLKEVRYIKKNNFRYAF